MKYWKWISSLALAAQFSACSAGSQNEPDRVSAAPVLERQALQVLIGEEASPKRAAVVSKFRFQAPQSRKEIRQYLRKKANELFLKELPAEARRELLSVFWNLVEVEELERDSITQDLVPFLQDLVLLEGSPLDAHVRLALDGYEARRFSGDELQVLTAELAVLETDRDLASPAFQSHLLRHEAHIGELMLSGPSFLDQARGMKFLSRSGELARRVLSRQIFDRQLFDFSSPRALAAGPVPPMEWSFIGTAIAGRCGATENRLSGQSIRNVTIERGCRYGNNGNDSVAQIRVGALETRVTGNGVFLSADVHSYVRGGFRHGGLFRSPPEENGTSTVRLSAQGRTVIPACSDPARCDLMLRVSAQCQNVPGGACRVILRTPALGGEFVLSSGVSVEVDRAEHAVELEVVLGRDTVHVGSWGELPWQHQAVEVNVESANGREGESMSAAQFYSTLEEELSQGTLRGFAERLPRAQLQPEFEDRYLTSYGRLLLARWAVERQDAPLNGVERKHLEFAVRSLSEEFRERLLPILNAFIRDREALYESLPISQLSDEIVRLLEQRSDAPELDSARLAESLQNVPEMAQATRSQDLEQVDPLLRVSGLMEIRSRLRALELQWRDQLVLLIAERAQLLGEKGSLQ